MNTRALLPLLGPLLLTSACASIVEGTTQTVTIISDPPGASCDLRRNGSMLSVVNTPGSAVVSKSKTDVTVECNKPGYLQTASSLRSDFQGMAVGNALLGLVGGGIGLIVDASTGAMHEYPNVLTVILPPEQFGSLEERDAWFARQAARIEEETATALAKVRRDCLSGNQPSEDDCREAVAAIEKERDRRLAANEAQRQAAGIGSTAS